MHLSVFLNLSVIIPASVGIYLFKSINRDYRYFIINLWAATFNELNAEFKFVNSQFFEIIYAFFYTQLILLLYFAWDGKKYITYKKWVIHIVLFVLVAIDQYYDYLSIYHIKWAFIISIISISLYGIRLLTQGQNNSISRRDRLSRKLIIIPYLVFSVYYAMINILMHFLFNKSNQLFFLNLYSVIRWINLLSYISYTLALLWAPKKERFL